MTGLQQSGRYRFLTLTTVPGTTEAELQRGWRRLASRLRRWNLGSGRLMTAYIKVVERGPENGNLHAHVLFRGQYIDQRVISWLWESLMGAPVVDIRAIKGRKSMAGEIAKYMSKDPKSRLAYSWSWAWPSLASTWKEFTAYWRRKGYGDRAGWSLAFALWRRCARWKAPPQWLDPAMFQFVCKHLGLYLPRVPAEWGSVPPRYCKA